MTQVRKLDPEAIDRIAAGEVVTRPASVVRELLDNAIDAGAGRIDVEIENSGLDLIRVSDDGHGMAEADARRAFDRHTTSKITDPTEVSRVSTLGFRGEALPSIASVARVDVTTRRDGHQGLRLSVREGGDEREATPAGRGVGTTVAVQDLFYNRSARRKGLASPGREFSRISDVVTRYALAHPDVRFELTHDGREVLATPGTGYTDALLGAYDRTVAARSEPVEVDGEYAVSGVAVHPSITRSKPHHVYVAVNGRPLRETDLRSAVRAGYDRLLPEDRYPVAAMNLSVPPAEIDANVHPAKAEVAFEDEAAVADAVTGAVRAALRNADLARAGEVAMDVDSSLQPVEAESVFADVDVAGGFRDLYLLAITDEEVLVIDQHAAHERVNYERLRAAMDDEPSRATVDPPETVRLSPAGASLVAAHREDLAGIGFSLSAAGGNAYRVAAVPAPLGRPLEPAALRDVVDDLVDGDVEDPREELLAELACHPSLKAGDELDEETATRLVERLGACEQPYACPHGRPTVLSIDEAMLAKGFERGSTRLG